MKDRISINIENGVADVRMIRTDKMNALDFKMIDALIEAGEVVAKDKSVRSVVLSGDGRAFCAGLDTSIFQGMMSADGFQPVVERTHGITNKFQKMVWVWRECPVPVIAAVHGVCFGGGFQLSLGADIRITHPDSKLSIMESKWGIVPDMCGPYIMQSLAREDIIRELTYTGRIFSGAEAFDYGFVSRLSSNPLEEGLNLAKEIAIKSPGAMLGAKKLFNELGEKTEAEAFLLESEIQDSLIGTKNQMESVMAGVEKRAGNFENER